MHSSRPSLGPCRTVKGSRQLKSHLWLGRTMRPELKALNLNPVSTNGGRQYFPDRRQSVRRRRLEASGVASHTTQHGIGRAAPRRGQTETGTPATATAHCQLTVPPVELMPGKFSVKPRRTEGKSRSENRSSGRAPELLTREGREAFEQPEAGARCLRPTGREPAGLGFPGKLWCHRTMRGL